MRLVLTGFIELSKRSKEKPFILWHQEPIADSYLEIALLSSFISNYKLKWGVSHFNWPTIDAATLTTTVCGLWPFLTLTVYFCFLKLSGGKKTPCNKRRIKAYFHWMSQHVRMGKAAQTVCVTREIRNIKEGFEKIIAACWGNFRGEG